MERNSKQKFIGKSFFQKIFEHIFFECPESLYFIFLKISLQKVLDFKKSAKKYPVEKNKKSEFSRDYSISSNYNNCRKICVEKGLNDQINNLKFSLPKNLFFSKLI
jgi:hypothetical protein